MTTESNGMSFCFIASWVAAAAMLAAGCSCQCRKSVSIDPSKAAIVAPRSAKNAAEELKQP